MNAMLPYTSTSALNLEGATIILINQFGDMLAWGNDVTTWTNQCKPTPTGTAPSNSICSRPNVNSDLAAAQQMINGYAALLSVTNDGSGNPTIADVLRGMILSSKMPDGIPSVQVAVSGAGGNTRTNSFFLLNLFYTPKPSFNAGVIATFELRDKNNELVESGARSALFDYKKWKPGSFYPEDIKPNGDCTTFCSEN